MGLEQRAHWKRGDAGCGRGRRPPDPTRYDVRIVDENVEPDFDDLARADIVGATGMNAARPHAPDSLNQRRATYRRVARGRVQRATGSWLTSCVGEPRRRPQFLEEREGGRHAGRYQQSEFTDMSRLPVPRFDLLRMRDYLSGTMQISRGCPFRCEFCDIVVTYGHRVRVKTGRQVTAELDELHRHRTEIVYITDDNLAGNRQLMKPLLRDIAAWQEAHGYTMLFSASASPDPPGTTRADGVDGYRANGQRAPSGESPNEESLRETRKLQNLRAADGSDDHCGER
jgi:hypothetical protein